MRIPSLKLLIGWVLLYTVLIVYGYARFYRDPGSIFYDPDRAFVRQYTDFRLRQVAAFISAYDKDALRPVTKAGASPKICVHVTTVKRDGQQYIDETIASVLEGLTSEEREDIYVSVFFANTDPTIHPSYHNPWLRHVVDEVYSVPPDNGDLIHRLEGYEDKGDYSAKGVVDYAYGLQHCYDKGMPFLLMLEGDVIAADGWLVKTLEGLDRVQKILRKSPSDWIYLRLFNQERSTGWASHKVGANNELWISLAIAAALLCFAAVLRRYARSSTILTDNASLALICALIIPSLVVGFFQAGKANVLPPRPGVFEQNFGCCSQALLYPRRQVPRLTQYLQNTGKGQVDLMVNRHAASDHLSRFSLYPVQFQHVGIQSSRKTLVDEARSIWSMAFEDKNPVALERDHQRLVEAIYHSKR
ncbi:uncharacterized protein BCR38DRAFT_349829 [Pseudomassariella vexata]|uniref:Integral membrane protein n=1 Tax=Pseudomassariella vexata TaxID=1141098 RepID=A0A1Y2DP74_9PEZI|nr:uncharacterized protein BCR38DRAFT_349829 [Pseudomassariella vexata]ORY61007.1 hypothetical protein BCR38DRAFT_349829 [Pseudomassariella vexata]